MARPGRGGDRKSGGTYGPNVYRYKPVCLWCGEQFLASRPDAITCNTAHRVAFNRFVKKHGRPPMFPFGLKPNERR